jgi:hypothetical protein
LSAKFEEERQRNAQEAKKPTTKSRTKERKVFYDAVSKDYAWLISMVINSVFMDMEDKMLPDLEKHIRTGQQRIEAEPEKFLFPQERIAVLQNAYSDLCQMFPAQRAAKRGRTGVLI